MSEKVMYLPAGFSDSDEYSDSEDEFGFSYGKKLIKKTCTIPLKKEIEISADDELILACDNGNLGNMLKCLSLGANVKYVRKDGWNCLLSAANSGNFEIIEILLEKGADPNFKYKLRTPLITLVSSNKKEEDLLKCLKLLIENGSDYEAKDWLNVTVLMHSVKNNCAQLSKYLLEIGCKVNEVDNNGWSAIFYAVSNRNIELIELLKKFEADLKVVDKRHNRLEDLLDNVAEEEANEILRLINLRQEVDLGCNIDIHLSNYSYVMSQLPKTGFRFFGFSSDVKYIIRSLHLQHLNDAMINNHVQLGDLLTATDEQLRHWGVYMSFDRKIILNFVKNFTEYRWHNRCLGKLLKTNVDLFSLSQQLSNIIRQLFVVNVITYNLTNYKMCQETSIDSINNYIKIINHMRILLKNNLQLTKSLDEDNSCISSDYILYKYK